MKRKTSNHRQYILLCEDEPRNSRPRKPLFPKHLETLNRNKLIYNDEEVKAYLVFNHEIDRYQLLVKYKGFTFRKTSNVEGNLWLIITSVDMVESFLSDAIALAKRKGIAI